MIRHYGKQRVLCILQRTLFHYSAFLHCAYFFCKSQLCALFDNDSLTLLHSRIDRTSSGLSANKAAPLWNR
jgi:hypothetical protein